MTAGGKTDTPMAQRIFWCIALGLIGISLLLGGGAASLQALALATAFPFTIILIMMMFSLLPKLARSKPRTRQKPCFIATFFSLNFSA